MVTAGTASAQLGSLLSPGRLAKGHEKLEGLSNCSQCHESGRKVTAAKCLACHAPIAQRIARKTGVHKDVKDECVACHADHAGVNGELRPFDTKTFDHARTTTFALDGKHANLKDGCAACHKQRTFLDLKTECASCHQDVHKPTLGATCQTCHSTKVGFKEIGTGFDHTKAAFQLTGAHRNVTCEKCHVNQQFKGIAYSTCASCHKDPHKPAQVTASTTCTSCHTSTDNWRARQFDHGRTAYALVGSHQKVDCIGCHKQPAMRVKPRADTCATCHADPHRGAFAPQDCKACHNESGFSKAPFDHSKTKFQLTGKHAPVTCESCHKNTAAAAAPTAVAARPAVNRTPASGGRGAATTNPPVAARGNRVLDFRGLSTTCVSCHTDVHQAQLGTTCESCHNVDGFKVPTFTHTTPAAPFFGGQHAALTCSQCHKPQGPQGVTQPVRTGVPLVVNVQYRGVQTTCVSCHQDIHLGQEGTACESCHSIERAKFLIPAFEHATRAAFKLTGKHETTTCVQCHKRETAAFPAGSGEAVRYKGLGQECRACHQDVHLGQVDARCESCHTTSAFKIAKYVHRNARKLTGFFVGAHAQQACAGCHKPATAQFPGGRGTAIKFTVDTRCVSCHNDIHRGALGPDCANCHRL